MKTLKVFISSPYTIGDVAANVRTQHDVFNNLIELGFNPFMPLLAHYQHIVHPLNYDKWLEWDCSWIDSCDFVLRLPGESKGADIETKYANDNGIPVVRSINELKILTKEIPHTLTYNRPE